MDSVRHIRTDQGQALPIAAYPHVLRPMPSGPHPHPISATAVPPGPAEIVVDDSEAVCLWAHSE